MDNKNNALSWVCSGITFATGFAFEDIIRVIMLIIGCVSAIVSLAYNIYCWYTKAKADGKITADEFAELNDELDKAFDNIKNQTKGGKDNGQD